MPMLNRQYGVGYRFGFNGKEQDNEVEGKGDVLDYGSRIYDPRLARFLSVDPLTKSFSMLTPYQFAKNCPIIMLDLDGLEGVTYLEVTKDAVTGKETPVRRIVEVDVYLQVNNNDDKSYHTTDGPLVKARLDREYNSCGEGGTNLLDPDDNVPVQFNIKVIPFEGGASEKKQELFNSGESIVKNEKGEAIGDRVVILSKGKLEQTKPDWITEGKFKNNVITVNEDISSKTEGHTTGHELFHYMTKKNPDLADIGDDEAKHAEAGGILKYGTQESVPNPMKKGSTMIVETGTEPLNQKNIRQLKKSLINLPNKVVNK